MGCEALENRALLSGVPPHSLLSQLPSPPTIVGSTIPGNGDLNPYGVAFVPKGILVSNFNSNQNLQGTGTTIVRINRDGTQNIFFQGQPGIGLTGALGVLSKGFVLVGSVPTTDGMADTVQQGSLLVINKDGKVVANVANSQLLDGPWGMAVIDHGNTAQVFISNVLSGTVTRLDLKIENGTVKFTSAVQIASGYTIRTDPAALVVGPTGLAYNAKTDVLYVASTGDNEIFAIPHASGRKTDAGTGKLVYADTTHLHGPLGLVIAPNGDLITINGDAVNPPDAAHVNEMVEFTPQGQFVDQLSISSTEGAAFGLAIKVVPQGLVLAAVNDADNTLERWTVLFPNKKHDS